MPKIRIGLHEFCPMDHVTVAGETFSKLSGAPGHAQRAGTDVEWPAPKLAEVRNAIDQREMRFFAKGCAVALKDQDRARDVRSEDGKFVSRGEILRGPLVRKCVPLDKFLYIVPEGEEAHAEPDPTPVAEALPDLAREPEASSEEGDTEAIES